MSEDEKIKSNKIFMIVWTVLLYSQFIYAFVVYSQTKQVVSFDFEGAMMIAPMVVCAVLAGVLSFMVPRLLLKNKRPVDYNDALKISFVPFLLKWIFAESIVIFGLILSFRNEKNLIAPFLLSALIIFLISFPSQNNIKRMTGLLRS